MHTYKLTSKEKVLSSQKWISDGLADLQRPCWCTKVVHQYGISIQSSIKLREMSWQITQKWRTTET